MQRKFREVDADESYFDGDDDDDVANGNSVTIASSQRSVIRSSVVISSSTPNAVDDSGDVCGIQRDDGTESVSKSQLFNSRDQSPMMMTDSRCKTGTVETDGNI